MNIREAKLEIKNTIRAYLAKDEAGILKIPREKQRPILLIGPPGIGKTAIMEQIASEERINLVSYSMTHHTRQSAMGLPFISHKSYGGTEYSVTDYTMSEIVAAVYEKMESTGISEGILFLDEINCVSETLSPVMLQLLQYKRFGMHEIPEGFILVAAGNPVEYNSNARELDIVTLDRVKKMEVTADLRAFQSYALELGIHGAVLAYLAIHKDHFYLVKQDIDGKRFVTARGWEDLSSLIRVYEEMGVGLSEEVVSAYLEDPEIAERFAVYYELYTRYRDVYHIPEILEGSFPENKAKLLTAPFDEKLGLISFICDALLQECRDYMKEKTLQKNLHTVLRDLSTLSTINNTNKTINTTNAANNTINSISNLSTNNIINTISNNTTIALNKGDNENRDDVDEVMGTPVSVKNISLASLLRERSALEDEDRVKLEKAHILSSKEAALRRMLAYHLTQLSEKCESEGSGIFQEDYDIAKKWFSERESARQKQILKSSAHLTNALSYIDKVFSEGQEMVLFLTELSKSPDFLQFVSDCGNESYYHYNKFLLLKDRRESLKEEVKGMLEL